MKADKYLESIGLGNVIDEEFFNDDDKSWYKVQELMESYHQSKLDLLTVPVVMQALPKRLSNRAYGNAKTMRYEDFVKWWDEQV